MSFEIISVPTSYKVDCPFCRTGYYRKKIGERFLIEREWEKA